MCRVAVRQASANAHRQAEQQNVIDSSNGSVQGNRGQEYFDVDALLGELDQSSADADFAFMQYLNSGIVPQATVPQEQQLQVVQGQPVGYASQQALPGNYVQPMMMMPTQPSSEYVDDHSMNNNYLAGYQMQQQQIGTPAMHQDSVNGAPDDGAKEKPAKRTRGKKAKKTPEEIAEQVERVKRRRRESAHRSRQKRFEYIKTLENENQTLKMENERLRQMLSSPKVAVEAKEDGSVASLEYMEKNKNDDMYAKSELAGSNSVLFDSAFNDIICKANSQEIAMAADLLGIKTEE